MATSVALLGFAFEAQTNDRVNLWRAHLWFKILSIGAAVTVLCAIYVLTALFSHRLPLPPLRGSAQAEQGEPPPAALAGPRRGKYASDPSAPVFVEVLAQGRCLPARDCDNSDVGTESTGLGAGSQTA